MRAEWGNDEGESAAGAPSRAAGRRADEDPRGAGRLQAGLRADLGRRPVRELQGRRHPALLRERLRLLQDHDAARTTSGTSRAARLFEVPGNRVAAKHLASGLIEAGFDTAYSYKPLHHSLGHAFANAHPLSGLLPDRLPLPDRPGVDQLLRPPGHLPARRPAELRQGPRGRAISIRPRRRPGACSTWARRPRGSWRSRPGGSPCWLRRAGRTRS